LVTISSGLCRLIPMSRSSSTNYRGGPTHGGKTKVIDAGADLAGIVLSQVDLKRQVQYHDGGTYYNTAYQKYYDSG
jgi:hypothetical protein